jgi:hypothetical protein
LILLTQLLLLGFQSKVVPQTWQFRFKICLSMEISKMITMTLHLSDLNHIFFQEVKTSLRWNLVSIDFKCLWLVDNQTWKSKKIGEPCPNSRLRAILKTR